jgi:ribosomal protein S27AE
MNLGHRGRPRKHKWIEFGELVDTSTPHALFLKQASINNSALANLAVLGCPRCGSKNFRLRHDQKFGNIRFYCEECKYETSFHIISPKRSLSTIEIYDGRGVLIGEKNVDDYHEKTVRENVDSRVLMAERKLDLGGEWFDGVSGVNSQSRCLTREEVLKRIEIRKMKKFIEVTLEDIEHEEEDNRLAGFEADIQ